MKKLVKMILLTVTVFIIVSLLFTACVGDDDGTDDTIKIEGKFRIANWANDTLNGENTFLYDNNGSLAIQAETDNDSQFWIVEQFNGKTRIKNVATNNYLNMKGVTPSWGGDEASEGIAKISAFEDIEEFYWEFTGDKDGSMQIFTAKTWQGGKALLSLNSIAHLEGAEPGNIAKLDAFRGTVQCRNDLDAHGLTWGTCFWTFYEFD